MKYLYLEIQSSVYYNTNLAPSAEDVGSIVSNNTQKYADSSEMNKYGARFKYSKFLKIIDDSSDAIISILDDNIFYSKFFEIICILIDKHAEII